MNGFNPSVWLQTVFYQNAVDIALPPHLCDDPIEVVDEVGKLRFFPG